MRMSDRDRRDWSLLIFIVPLGILLMLIAGQFAMRVIPRWILKAGMGSSLKVETAGGQETFMEPLFSIQILTPFSWQNTYLTPNADSGFVFPPFVVLEPSATPSPTEAPSSTETAAPPPATASPSATTMTPSATLVVTATTPPPPQETSIPPTDIPTDAPTTAPTSVVTPTPTCTDPAATNNGGSLPCTYTPITSTPDPTYTILTPPPTAIGVGTNPDGGVGGGGAGAIGLIPDGRYVLLGLNIVVGNAPDGNYDLAFYEFDSGGVVNLDWVIIGISNAVDGNQYYEVFNWGNGIPDTNSNLGDVAGTEADDQPISTSEFYDPDGTAGPAPQTGILIDVDNASSHPPPGTYDTLWIISPPDAAMIPAEEAQADAVQTVEVPIPTPTPTP